MNCAHNIVIANNEFRQILIEKKGEDYVERLLRIEMVKAGMDLTRPVEIEVDLKRNQFIVRQACDPKNDPQMPRAGEEGSGIIKKPRRKIA